MKTWIVVLSLLLGCSESPVQSGGTPPDDGKVEVRIVVTASGPFLVRDKNNAGTTEEFLIGGDYTRRFKKRQEVGSVWIEVKITEPTTHRFQFYKSGSETGLTVADTSAWYGKIF